MNALLHAKGDMKVYIFTYNYSLGIGRENIRARTI